ncbi:Sigma-54 dependent transcriptional regulator/response regulator [Chitinispirillum alkaliphilum]|nr:Sigma-54 dependent transcriptional regulator/response regulator [Chitinispirillum alkaliphilum]
MVDTLINDEYEITEFDPQINNPELLERHFDVAVLDIMMGETDGFEIREKVLKFSPGAQIIMITGYPDIEKHKKAIDQGVFMFLTKPLRAEQLFYTVKGALQLSRLHSDALNSSASANSHCPGLIGKSEHIAQIKRKILEFAPTEIPVLITGESGTGKEVVAKCLHEESSRCSKPFITVNCAGLSPNLIESELFGHVQGAFTGAAKTRHGFFAVADGGTLFLDEIGEMPLHIQSKLLRILDNGEFYRVGDTEKHNVDVRILSATNRDLSAMVNNGEFRKDLFYRLQGVHFELEPLHKRKDDIGCLVQHFIRDEKYIFSPGALKLINEADWPGNVRELSMFVGGFNFSTCGDVITEQMVRKRLALKNSDNVECESLENKYVKFKDYRKNLEIDYFDNLMKQSEGNISKAAKISGLDRKNLREKLKTFGLYDG